MKSTIKCCGAAAWTALLSVSPAPAHADMVTVLSNQVVTAPSALGFSNSTSGGNLAVGTLAGVYNFLDRWTFNLGSNAEVGGFVGSFNFTDNQNQVLSGINNLQIRLVGPSTLLVGWSTVQSYNGFQNLFSVVAPTGMAAGAYAIEIRGTLIGTASAYAGTLQAVSAVPLPPVGLSWHWGSRAWWPRRAGESKQRGTDRTGGLQPSPWFGPRRTGENARRGDFNHDRHHHH